MLKTRVVEMKKTPSPQMMKNHGQTTTQNGYLANKNHKKSFKDVARKVSQLLSFSSCKRDNSSRLQVLHVHDHGRNFASKSL